MIIQSTSGSVANALGAFNRVDRLFKGRQRPQDVDRTLGLVDGVAVTLPAKKIDELAKIKGLTITPDAPVHVSGYTSKQLWPYEAGLANGWSGPEAPRTGSVPTIAVVDSGIQPGRADFGNRLLASVNLGTLPDNSPATGAVTARSWRASPRARPTATPERPRRRISSRSTSWTTTGSPRRAT